MLSKRPSTSTILNKLQPAKAAKVDKRKKIHILVMEDIKDEMVAIVRQFLGLLDNERIEIHFAFNGIKAAARAKNLFDTIKKDEDIIVVCDFEMLNCYLMLNKDVAKPGNDADVLRHPANGGAAICEIQRMHLARKGEHGKLTFFLHSTTPMTKIQDSINMCLDPGEPSPVFTAHLVKDALKGVDRGVKGAMTAAGYQDSILPEGTVVEDTQKFRQFLDELEEDKKERLGRIPERKQTSTFGSGPIPPIPSDQKPLGPN